MQSVCACVDCVCGLCVWTVCVCVCVCVNCVCGVCACVECVCVCVDCVCGVCACVCGGRGTVRTVRQIPGGQ